MKKINVLLLVVFTIFFVIAQAHRYSSPKRRKMKFIPAEPKEDCYGIQCISPSPYPKKYIKSLLRQIKFSSTTQKVFEPIEKFEMKLKSPFEDEPEDEVKNVCESKEVTVFPKTAKDENYKLKFIVNTKQHQQGITYETCVTEEAFINKLLLHYYFFCKQNYSTVRLLYLTEDGKLDYGKFPVPSACVCSYKTIKT